MTELPAVPMSGSMGDRSISSASVPSSAGRMVSVVAALVAGPSKLVVVETASAVSEGGPASDEADGGGVAGIVPSTGELVNGAVGPDSSATLSG